MGTKNKKNSKNNNLILLKSIIEENKKKLELDKKEVELKDKLLLIEDKLKKVEKVILTIKNEKTDTIFDSESFSMLVGSIAITAAVNIIAEYFDLNKEDIDKLL